MLDREIIPEEHHSLLVTICAFYYRSQVSACLSNQFSIHFIVYLSICHQCGGKEVKVVKVKFEVKKPVIWSVSIEQHVVSYTK